MKSVLGAHTEQPLPQFSQHKQPSQGTAAPPQRTRHLQLPFRLRSYVLWIWIKRQTEALQVFIIYLIVGHQKSTTHFFFLSTLDFDLSNCNGCRNLSKIVFYILQSTVYCISLINKSYHDILFVLTGSDSLIFSKAAIPFLHPLKKCWQYSAKLKKYYCTTLDSFVDLNTMGATSYTQLMNDVAF